MATYAVTAFRDYTETYWPNNRRAPIVSLERCSLVSVVVNAYTAVDAIRAGIEEIEARGYNTDAATGFQAETV